MGKFKVGDRVRCVQAWPGGVVAGEDYTVSTVHEDAGTLSVAEIRNKYWNFERFVAVPEGPVRIVTITRKEIVRGDFGKVSVGGLVLIPDCNAPWNKSNRAIDLHLTGPVTKPELTAAIATLTAVRDALDEVV